jgi:pSer/pThr/pTyr-binding forkhead associated (FHA) protein
MAFVRVYFDGVLKEEVEIQKDVTTIGRNINNDVAIDNRGVSSVHAKLIKKDDAFIIEDAGFKTSPDQTDYCDRQSQGQRYLHTRLVCAADRGESCAQKRRLLPGTDTTRQGIR